MSNRVCVLHTGGTIGMLPTPRGLEPAGDFLLRYLEQMPELGEGGVPDWEMVRLDPLLDSADMRPADWVRIGSAIADRGRDYVGFVVLHGTDTMTYTASALSFLLAGLDRPVVVTGSQLPLQHVRTDGRQHLIASIIIAGTLAIPEVGLYFATRLLRGNRAQKIRNQDFVAFESGNCWPLARVGVNIEVDWTMVRAAGAGIPGRVGLERVPEVVAVRIFPGMSATMLERVFAPPAEAVVLETYGSGTFPSRDGTLLGVVERAVRRGVLVVNCSQCHAGRVRQDQYATSHSLASVGAVSGSDMTPEAALAKLICLLGAGHTADRVRELVATDLAGELTTESR